MPSRRNLRGGGIGQFCCSASSASALHELVPSAASSPMCRGDAILDLQGFRLALEPSFVVGNCEGGYSCAYVNTMSWQTPTMPLPMETNPHVVFERLFGDGSGGRARLEQMRKDRSILDAVKEDMVRLQRILGPRDRSTVTEYLARPERRGAAPAEDGPAHRSVDRGGH